MSLKTWRGNEVVTRIADRLVAAVNEIDGRIEAHAKAQLYPGHGKRSGMLQRSIQSTPARREGNRIRGVVGTKGVRYALRIHKRYRYIVIGFEQVQGHVLSIIRRHTKQR